VRQKLSSNLVWQTILDIFYRCPKSLEPMEILTIFLIFIYRLKLKVKSLKIALTLDERVEIVLLSGSQGWTQRQVADEFNGRHPELQTAVLLLITIC
jgi:hypothetical protein